MAVFHNPYDSILMLPVMFGLYSYVETAPSPAARRRARIALWVLQAALLIEIAGRWRALAKGCGSISVSVARNTALAGRQVAGARVLPIHCLWCRFVAAGEKQVIKVARAGCGGVTGNDRRRTTGDDDG
jgi:hypothetical protein